MHVILLFIPVITSLQKYLRKSFYIQQFQSHATDMIEIEEIRLNIDSLTPLFT